MTDETDKLTEVEKRLKDIKENPERHQHTFEGLLRCSMVGAVLDSRLFDAHLGTVPQRNPGGCDVTSGPCSCGAWHR